MPCKETDLQLFLVETLNIQVLHLSTHMSTYLLKCLTISLIYILFAYVHDATNKIIDKPANS